MEKHVKTLLLFILMLFGVWGCAATVPQTTGTGVTEDRQGLSDVELKDLAGEWEYREGSIIYPLMFDQEGNGTYEWKEGKFTTSSLKDGVWKGTWHQQENDREGGFEMRLGQDVLSATGRWWYTRIEQDHDPLDPGGTFTIHRILEN